MLLGGRCGEMVFDYGGYVGRMLVCELTDFVRAALSREAARGVQVGLARVVVGDVRGEEFQRSLRGLRCWREDRGRCLLWGRGEDDFSGHAFSASGDLMNAKNCFPRLVTFQPITTKLSSVSLPRAA